MPMSRLSNRAAQPNIIWRVGMLPLMSSTSQVLLMTYSDVKRTNWLTSTLCNALETGARMATGLAVRRAKPILDIFEPQFASANTFASKRLDKLEEEFPILQLSIDEVAWHLRESLTLTLDNAQEHLSEETMKLRVRAGALAEQTRAFISCQAAAFLNTGPGQLMAARGDSWLRWLEEMVDRHLPDSAGDCILEDAGVRGFERDTPEEPGLPLRVQRLTLKVHSHLYQRVLLSCQRAQEVALTDIMLLMELFDWLAASWAFSVLNRSFQSPLGLSISVIWPLAGLQAGLSLCSSENGLLSLEARTILRRALLQPRPPAALSTL
ncbi:perilipin-3-like isoform X3 [Stegostoma tigrinum]|uniref:perilipin-3-like isoform X3 n=1 Tax=Stegostoma tigrinum TaxID=3053191 RepID=UPI00287034C0|nr:perilipin-3-like isoform X3 [Stegostoma tigrinum]